MSHNTIRSTTIIANYQENSSPSNPINTVNVVNISSYGEPGPSSQRNSRRTLSRHQQNADELDSMLMNNKSSRLRLRSSTHALPEGISSSENQGENSTDDIDSNEGTEGSNKIHDSDSDDNQPLGSIFGNTKKNRNTRNIKRPRYNISTDDENSFNEKVLSSHKKTRNDAESFDEDNDDNDSQHQIVSISSRGRVRRIKPNARCIFRKE